MRRQHPCDDLKNLEILPEPPWTRISAFHLRYVTLLAQGRDALLHAGQEDIGGGLS